MHCQQQRALALSHYVKARLNLVPFGFQSPTRNYIRHHRYSARKWLVTWHQTVISFLVTFLANYLKTQ